MSRTPQGSQSLADDLNDDNQSEPGELSWFAKKRYSVKIYHNKLKEKPILLAKSKMNHARSGLGDEL